MISCLGGFCGSRESCAAYHSGSAVQYVERICSKGVEVPFVEAGKVREFNGASGGNPWGLTPSEVRCIDAVIEHSSAKRAAAVLGMHHDTVRTHCNTGGRKIDKDNTYMRYIKWYMWRQGFAA